MRKKIIGSLLIILIAFSTFCMISYARTTYTYCGNVKLLKRYGYTDDDVRYFVAGVLNPTATTELTVPSVADDGNPITYIWDNTKSTGVFESNIYLEKVDLSKSQITYIYDASFRNCSKLTEFITNKDLRTISRYVFQGAKLNDIKLNEGLTSIGISAFEDAFNNEKKLYIIDIPDSVTNIGENAFRVNKKDYKVVLSGKKGSVVEKYCETDTTCTFMERGTKPPTDEEILAEEIRKEKEKIFVNPEFVKPNYNQSNEPTKVARFAGIFSKPKISTWDVYSDIIDVGDGLIVVGFSHLKNYTSTSSYIQENYLKQARGNDDAIIVKYDYNLAMKWIKCFGGSLGDKFSSIYKTKDSGYLVFGSTCSIDKDLLNKNFDANNYQDMVVKYDSNFNVKSVKIGKFAELYQENKNTIIEEKKVSNGKIELNTISNGKLGVESGADGYEMNSLITKYDDKGYKEWTKEFDYDSNKTDDKLKKVIEVSDGYVFIGSTFKAERDTNNKFVEYIDAIIVKYNNQYDQIIINGPLTYEMLVGNQRQVPVFYVPWEDVKIGEMNWTSDDENIATVDYKGNITARNFGTTKIHLEIRGKTAEIIVVVKDPSIKQIKNITLNKTECTIEKGKTETLIPTINPIDASNKELEWISSNTNVATVINGTVTAVSEGTTTIIVRAKDGSKKEAICMVTVLKQEEAKPTIPGGEVETKEKLGDLNGDGEVTGSDAVSILKSIAGNITLNNSQQKLADINKDGEITGEDAVRILKYVAGNITKLEN